MNIETLGKLVKQHYQNNTELKERKFEAFSEPCALWFLESIANEEFLSEFVVTPLTKEEKPQNKLTFKTIESTLTNASINELKTIKEVKKQIAVGSGIVYFEQSEIYVEIPVKQVPRRSIAEPPTNNVVRGPREGFIEDYKTNISLIRARLATNNLKIEELEIGSLTKTKVCVTYIKGIASAQVVKQILKRLKSIKIDGIIDSYYLETYLAEHPRSVFKQCGSSEKPDITVAKMLEGRVAIIVDGSPFVLTLPYILIEDLQSSEDYYDNSKKVSFVRVLRLLGVLIATVMPGLYISFQVYHYKALPLKFLITIFNSVYHIPFAPVAEVLFAFLLFEILYEASVRIPKGLGTSFNIIGALILGDTAVQSNLASAPTIMVIAISSIALYLVPDQTSVLRMIRISLTLIAGMMGIIGIVLALLFLVSYLSDFDSYGAAYLGPYAPRIKNDLKDAVFKKNITKMKTRPKSIPNENKNRVESQNENTKGDTLTKQKANSVNKHE